ncbi:hypothetical protein HH310_29180 [Actinoplanes sp. TBRC 11911]|uniref:hypothetical protein n=1 Tax=Actinoplanes sp. TBRC 11911 TaxID=2729386 RepID=UPI00145DCF9A|nr:hypothetical protein [Actinoplanes sp. TBRC 11911]NMO55245.1 hypothetical protein [Actinoplanes sp. TBRC 11911]
MRTHFAEVLAREDARLSGVVDRAMLACWRRDVVQELMTPRSPYALALRPAADMREQADFLDRWRELIAGTVERLLRSETQCPSVDAHRTAVLILAALRGGRTLAQLAGDRRPLDAALDLALLPLLSVGAI